MLDLEIFLLALCVGLAALVFPVTIGVVWLKKRSDELEADITRVLE